uniref:S1 motif domain-containing protein n=1 Tax=Strongyloides papillosus TaxID=174720 RepID=A0A0N5CFK8_STREA
MLLPRIVLFISLYKTIEVRIQARIPARILPTVYFVEVVGVAYCPYDFQGIGIVVLSLNPNNKSDIKPVEKMKVRYGQRLYIAGKVRAFGKPPRKLEFKK